MGPVHSRGGRIPLDTSLQKRLTWLFRIAVAAEFIGHGVFGWRCKPSWIPYFGVAGIEPDPACALMPWVGTHDVILGVIGFLSPRPLLLAWMVFWGTWTALLRPLAGELAWETIERAGNIGVPLAFLVLTWPRAGSLWAWLKPARVAADLNVTLPSVALILRVTTGLLLIGHGALAALVHKPMLLEHAALIGLPATGMGWFEILLGAAILVRPLPALLIVALAWKLVTESLFIAAGAPVWEFIERGGSYAAPLGLLWIVSRRPAPNRQPPFPAPTQVV